MITVAHLFYLLNMPWDNDPMIIKEDFNKILLNEENKKLFLKNYITPKEYNYKERSVRFSIKEVVLANTYFMRLPCYSFKSLESNDPANNVCLVLKCIKNRKGMKFEFMIHWKLQNMHGKNGESRTIYNDFAFDVYQRTFTIEKNKKHYPENKKVLDVEIRNQNCTRNSFYLSGGKEFFLFNICENPIIVKEISFVNEEDTIIFDDLEGLSQINEDVKAKTLKDSYDIKGKKIMEEKMSFHKFENKKEMTNDLFKAHRSYWLIASSLILFLIPVLLVFIGFIALWYRVKH